MVKRPDELLFIQPLPSHLAKHVEKAATRMPHIIVKKRSETITSLGEFVLFCLVD